MTKVGALSSWVRNTVTASKAKVEGDLGRAVRLQSEYLSPRFLAYKAYIPCFCSLFTFAISSHHRRFCFSFLIISYQAQLDQKVELTSLTIRIMGQGHVFVY